LIPGQFCSKDSSNSATLLPPHSSVA
jgi:hypothetical protein